MKILYVILILFLGIFFTSHISFANSSKKHTCEKEISLTKTKEKSCCDNNKGCKGTCNHLKCSCSMTCTSSCLSIFIKRTNNAFNFLSPNKAKFFYQLSSETEGYSSLWLIPKIS